jgi:hypothetical protein
VVLAHERSSFDIAHQQEMEREQAKRIAQMQRERNQELKEAAKVFSSKTFRSCQLD